MNWPVQERRRHRVPDVPFISTDDLLSILNRDDAPPPPPVPQRQSENGCWETIENSDDTLPSEDSDDMFPSEDAAEPDMGFPGLPYKPIALPFSKELSDSVLENSLDTMFRDESMNKSPPQPFLCDSMCTSNADTADPSYVLIQFPPLMPEIYSVGDEVVHPSVSSNSAEEYPHKSCVARGNMRLELIPEGCIGKLQIRRSGNATLSLQFANTKNGAATEAKADSLQFLFDECAGIATAANSEAVCFFNQHQEFIRIGRVNHRAVVSFSGSED